MKTIPIEDFHKWYCRANVIIPDKIAIIEDFIANGMTLYEVAVKHKTSYDTVCRTVEMYFIKPMTSLTLMSAV